MHRHYVIRCVHKIARDTDTAGPGVCFDLEREAGTARELAAVLRDRGLLCKGQGVRAHRVEPDGQIVVFPKASIWHALVLTPVLCHAGAEPCTKLVDGEWGARLAASRCLSRLGHLPLGQGQTFECAHCALRAHIRGEPGAWTLAGDMASKNCDVARRGDLKS